MKRLVLSALIAITVGTSAFAAGGEKVNFFVLNSFQSQFSNASNVTWTEGKGYSKATFLSGTERMEAFYNSAGELIATSKIADLNQLPVHTKRILAKKLDGYTIKEAIRFEGTEENAYYISAENERGSIIFKVDDKGNITKKVI